MKENTLHQERKLFNNPVLEKLTHTNSFLVIGTLSATGIILFVLGIIKYGISIPSAIGLFIAGVFVFTFVEYVLHRFVYHSGPNYLDPSHWQYTAHGVHHVYHKDKDRLAMPLPLALMLSGLFFLFFKFLMGINAFAFFPGFIIGYGFYLYIHYMVHASKPPKNFFRYLWHHHLKHHVEKYDNTAFGVSSPLWDIVFGTMPPKNMKVNQDND